MIWTEYLRFQSFDRSYLVDLPNLNSATDVLQPSASHYVHSVGQNIYVALQ